MPSKGILALALRCLIIDLDFSCQRACIELHERRCIGQCLCFFNATKFDEFHEFFFMGCNIKYFLIKNRIGKLTLGQNNPRKTRIACAFIAKAFSILTNENATFFNRGPRQEAPMRISDRGIALIGSHIREISTNFLTPADGFAG